MSIAYDHLKDNFFIIYSITSLYYKKLSTFLLDTNINTVADIDDTRSDSFIKTRR